MTLVMLLRNVGQVSEEFFRGEQMIFVEALLATLRFEGCGCFDFFRVMFPAISYYASDLSGIV